MLSPCHTAIVAAQREHDAAPAVGLCVQTDTTAAVVVAGPFAIAPQSHASSHTMHRQQEDEILVGRFSWPETGWVNSVRIAVVNADGDVLPRGLIHHLYLVTFDRRELVYPIVQRLLGAGQETGDIVLPPGVGLPLEAGDELGLYVMWDHPTGAPVPDAHLRLTLGWIPAAPVRHVVSVLPFMVDVRLVVGQNWTFDVPPGGVTPSVEFEVPTDVQLVGVGGHLHDHGAWLRLERASGDEVVTVRPERDASGRILRVPDRVVPFSDAARLRVGERYRLVARYDNPTADTLREAMATLAGIVIPIDGQWPSIDPVDSVYRHDLALLTTEHPGVSANAAPRCEGMPR